MLRQTFTSVQYPRCSSAEKASNSPWIVGFLTPLRRAVAHCVAVTWLVTCAAVALAQMQTPPLPPASPEVEARLKKLETELRCLVCQNQTLAESPAGLAGDLRREIRLLADSGKSNDEIKVFLKDRYGDFVLYNPPVSSKTYLLWFGPFLLLFAGGVIALMMARSRKARSLRTANAPTISDAELKRAEALLKE
jgi:cytochrome c-type biogenesis protein CcmH